MLPETGDRIRLRHPYANENDASRVGAQSEMNISTASGGERYPVEREGGLDLTAKSRTSIHNAKSDSFHPTYSSSKMEIGVYADRITPNAWQPNEARYAGFRGASIFPKVAYGNKATVGGDAVSETGEKNIPDLESIPKLIPITEEDIIALMSADRYHKSKRSNWSRSSASQNVSGAKGTVTAGSTDDVYPKSASGVSVVEFEKSKPLDLSFEANPLNLSVTLSSRNIASISDYRGSLPQATPAESTSLANSLVGNGEGVCRDKIGGGASVILSLLSADAPMDVEKSLTNFGGAAISRSRDTRNLHSHDRIPLCMNGDNMTSSPTMPVENGRPANGCTAAPRDNAWYQSSHRNKRYVQPVRHTDKYSLAPSIYVMTSQPLAGSPQQPGQPFPHQQQQQHQQPQQQYIQHHQQQQQQQQQKQQQQFANQPPDAAVEQPPHNYYHHQQEQQQQQHRQATALSEASTIEQFNSGHYHQHHPLEGKVDKLHSRVILSNSEQHTEEHLKRWQIQIRDMQTMAQQRATVSSANEPGPASHRPDQSDGSGDVVIVNEDLPHVSCPAGFWNQWSKPWTNGARNACVVGAKRSFPDVKCNANAEPNLAMPTGEPQGKHFCPRMHPNSEPLATLPSPTEVRPGGDFAFPKRQQPQSHDAGPFAKPVPPTENMAPVPAMSPPDGESSLRPILVELPRDILYMVCNLCGRTYGNVSGMKKHLLRDHNIRFSLDKICVKTISDYKRERLITGQLPANHPESSTSQIPDDGVLGRSRVAERTPHDSIEHQAAVERHQRVTQPMSTAPGRTMAAETCPLTSTSPGHIPAASSRDADLLTIDLTKRPNQFRADSGKFVADSSGIGEDSQSHLDQGGVDQAPTHSPSKKAYGSSETRIERGTERGTDQTGAEKPTVEVISPFGGKSISKSFLLNIVDLIIEKCFDSPVVAPKPSQENETL
ncbi:hypothetical protein LSH36_662g00012 [Paralvinella palmiformis]|uniref:C2H2-type domain-containing protein n=1 Tax=Paralvinella palmiformis TaxID=53620 RepID=A0AAD9MTX8_9ANNE|nr:hypothetical protein LSH36_662g00012 [Paralvinella palmiformis]